MSALFTARADTVQAPPFNWQHAELDGIRDFLVPEALAGNFIPSYGLSL